MTAGYAAFELAITADRDAQSAVERETVLRVASLLWRLRRATPSTRRSHHPLIEPHHIIVATGDGDVRIVPPRRPDY